MKTAIFVLGLLLAVTQSVDIQNVVEAEADSRFVDEFKVESDSISCTKLRQAEQRKCEGFMGCQVTQCDPDGSYSAKQCSGSTGYCWCVDTDGVEFENSRQKEWESGELDCEAMRAENATPCLKQHNAEESKCKGLMGCQVTQCDVDGSYLAKQCAGTGYCWCVDKDGVEFDGSRQREWESGALDCEGMRAGCSSDDQCNFHGRCYNGKCVCRLACPRILFQVCGSNGKTYDNYCLLEADACTKQMDIVRIYDGMCRDGEVSCDELECGDNEHCVVADSQARCVCTTDCDEFDEPVCGSDKKSYKSECHLNAASCKSKQRIRVVHQSECEEAEEVEEAESEE